MAEENTTKAEEDPLAKAERLSAEISEKTKILDEKSKELDKKLQLMALGGRSSSTPQQVPKTQEQMDQETADMLSKPLLGKK